MSKAANKALKSAAQNIWHYYSDGLDPALQQRVRTISDNGCEEFASSVLCYDPASKSARNEIQVQAWKDPVSQSWTVEKYVTTTLPKTGAKPAETAAAQTAGLGEKKTIMRGACFFDALYYVAYFEKTEKDMGAQVIGQPDDMTHYKDAGEGAGQAFDTKVMPHPTIGGRILTDGSFPVDAYEVAKKTKAIAPVKAPAQDNSPTALMLKETFGGTAVMKNEMEIIDQINQADKAVKALQKVRRSGWSVLNALKKESDTDGFKDIPLNFDNEEELTVLLGLVCSLMTLGAVPAVIGGVAIVKDLVRSVKFHNAFRNAAQQAKKLPEGPVKTMMEEFNKNARFTLYVERAARQVRQCVRDDKPFKARQKCSANVEKAARYLDLAPAEVQKLKMAVMKQEVNLRDMNKKLEAQWENINSKLSSQIRAIKAPAGLS